MAVLSLLVYSNEIGVLGQLEAFLIVISSLTLLVIFHILLDFDWCWLVNRLDYTEFTSHFIVHQQQN